MPLCHRTRPPHRSFVTLLGSLLLFCCPAPAHASGETLPLPLTGPLAVPQGSLMMLDRQGDALPLLAPRVSLQVLGGHGVLEGSAGEETVVRVDDALVAAVGVALGLGPADLGLLLPVHLSMSGERLGEPWHATRIGDLVFVPRAGLLPGDDLPLQLTLSVPVTFPTGDEEELAGRAGFTAEPRLRVALHTGRFHLALRPGVLLQGSRQLSRPELSSCLTLRAALGVGIGPRQAVRPEVGLDGMVPLGDRSLVGAEVLGGVAVAPGGGLSLALHGGLGVGQMPGIAAARVSLTVAWEGAGRQASD